MSDWKARLVRQLRLAYSGELAAALAYRGHARSLIRADERLAVRRILAEELQHRREVGEMLHRLGAQVDGARERRLFRIGSLLGRLCRWSGWLAPMWGAGQLERRNIVEYEDAAWFAHAAGEESLVEPLLHMAEVEWEHERYFRERVRSHQFSFAVPLWSEAGPQEEIRRRFAARVASEHSFGSLATTR